MLNSVHLIGGLGQDPEIRTTQSGTKVANLSVATSSRQKQGDEWVPKTEWHKVVVFGKTAEFCENYLAKGRTVFIDGRIQTRPWEDKDGNKRYTTEIVANIINALDKGDRSAGPKPQPGNDDPYETTTLDDDEIPF